MSSSKLKNDPPCFKQNCTNKRILGHVVCEEHHRIETCEKCLRVDELKDRMDKRRATIESRKRGMI